MSRESLLQGTLDLLVLSVVHRQSMHGFDIARAIQQRSLEALRVEEGSLYPALYRLETEGYLTSEWGHAANGKRAKFYSISRSGRKRLTDEESRWQRMVAAIGLVLAPEAE